VTAHSPKALDPAIAGALGVLAMLLTLSSCQPRVEPPAVGAPAPGFTLSDLEGKTHQLTDYRGQVVLINFWATWCPPCVEEMPSLEKLHRALGPKGLKVLAVSVDERVKDVERFRKDHDLTFTILRDKDRKVAHRYLTFKYPETYVLDREGKLVWKVVGGMDWVAPINIHNFVQLLGSTSD
jgi:cytochrome c biogenesis protein CcmG/thiol:disulfide interchange protein DsbE